MNDLLHNLIQRVSCGIGNVDLQPLNVPFMIIRDKQPTTAAEQAIGKAWGSVAFACLPVLLAAAAGILIGLMLGCAYLVADWIIGLVL